MTTHFFSFLGVVLLELISTWHCFLCDCGGRCIWHCVIACVGCNVVAVWIVATWLIVCVIYIVCSILWCFQACLFGIYIIYIVLTADPVVEECLQFASQSSLFISCGVGNRELWAMFVFIMCLTKGELTSYCGTAKSARMSGCLWV